MKTTEKVLVEKVEVNSFGKNQAQLRHVISSATGSQLRSQLFSNAELGKATFDSTRMDWIEVPTDATVESVQTLIDSYPNARITRYLSSKPIIEDNQKAVLLNGLKDEAFEDFKKENGIEAEAWNQECANALLAKIANSQIVRYGEGNAEGKPAEEEVLHNGLRQYRITRFNVEGNGDVDKRDGIAKLITLDIAPNPATVKETV